MRKNDYVSKVERLYRRHRSLIYWIAYAILEDEAWAKDASQETLARMLKYHDRLSFDSPVETKNYIARIARNTSFDMYNRRKKYNTVADRSETLPVTDNPTEEMYITKETVNEIVEIIRDMDPKYSDPLRFHKFDKMTVEQIAEIMGVSVRTVYYRIEKAKEIIKAELGKRGAGHE